MKRLIATLALITGGCAMAPSDRLTFPATPLTTHAGETWYDTNHDGKPDFALLRDDNGINAVAYDDNENGTPDRIYKLADYGNDDVPHVVILLDSIPYQVMLDRYKQGHFGFFSFPQKMIAPFPSLTEICYSQILGAPPLPTVIDTQYDPRRQAHRSDLWERVGGYRQPWERRLTYECSFAEAGLTFLDPQKWYKAELARCKKAIDESPRKTTIVYTGSAASMVCRFGRAGAEEVLDGAEQLCLQLLYERHGAIKISMMADHGHNLMESKNVDLAGLLNRDGFHVVDVPKTPEDVTISINGLVTNALIQTGNPRPVAAALVKHDAIDLAMYMDGDAVIIEGKVGKAAVRCESGAFTYAPITGDPLGYAELLKQPKMLMGEDEWLVATADHPWPNAPARLWHAFHRQTVMPPTIMLSFKDGFYCGKPAYEKFITMKSTHGGLNQINSATFVMTMNGKLPKVLLPREVMPALIGDEPVELVR